MTEVQSTYAWAFGTIGIDAKVLGLAAQFYGLPGQEMADAVSKQSVDWIGPSSLPAAPSEEVVISQSGVVYHSGLESEEQWSCSTLPENKNAGTAHMYNVVIADMDDKMTVICMRDLVGGEFCVAAQDGQRVYEAIKTELASGASVSLSFQGVRNITAVFLHLAIGQMYNGDFSDEDLKRKLNIIDISPERLFLIERTAQRAKEFFADPSRFCD
ncbi:MAG: STAS-like domain-containing protein [Methanothrix sp.]